MNCKKCGTPLNNDAKFCPECGEKVIEQNTFQLSRKDDEKSNVNSNRIVSIDNNENEEQKQIIDAPEKINTFRKSKFFKVIIIFFLISICVMFIQFMKGQVFVGIIALVQSIFFAGSWLMGMKLIKEKKHIYM